jgi:hypothetical protein
MTFVFGYGSLLNLCNHNINDVLYYVKLIPSVDFSVRRSFNTQSDKSIYIPNNYTALGIEYVEYDSAKPINGIIFCADEIKLQKLIEREKNYKIVELDLSLFEFINCVNSESNFDINKSKLIGQKIITFIPLHTKCASDKYPLSEKYIEICLDGFLSVDKLFACNFIDNTNGWSDDLLQFARNYVNNNLIKQ